ncbi:MAG TPA: carboxylesterase family protein [Steroidobacteraceae bacterium]|nr:carboxylesterase family protein [Steroidobacteraceae bacterium]
MTQSIDDTIFCVAETASGQVLGLMSGGVCQFKGVPYGASTAGAGRFKRPSPPVAWPGVRDCFGYGPVAPQCPADFANDYARLVHFDLNTGFGGVSEDCLHLNIWTPGTDRTARRAVLFSVHGGGFAIGSGNNPLYDGAKLASFGDVVVVTVTHRLASFGFLDLADLDSSGEWTDSGAAGMLDLVAALEWVRDNIANFGGDPGRVMIFGQSGGGWKVSTLLAMPAARGLFHRAAIQSGSLLRHLSRDEGARVAAAFVDKLGLRRGRLRELNELPWTQLLAAQSQVGSHLFAPVRDGVHLETDPYEPVAPVESCDVPLIVSTTLDDAGLFFSHFDLTEPELRRLLARSYGAAADHLLALYREHFPAKSPYLLHAQMVTDAGFRRFANAQAERKALQARAAVYTYLWEWPSPAFDGKFGAVHAIDVAASLHNERDPIMGGGGRDARMTCTRLASAWVNFAKTGSPNSEHIPDWPRFDGTRRSTMVFAADTRVVHDPYRPIREYWLGMPGPASVFG